MKNLILVKRKIRNFQLNVSLTKLLFDDYVFLPEKKTKMKMLQKFRVTLLSLSVIDRPLTLSSFPQIHKGSKSREGVNGLLTNFGKGGPYILRFIAFLFMWFKKFTEGSRFDPPPHPLSTTMLFLRRTNFKIR